MSSANSPKIVDNIEQTRAIITKWKNSGEQVMFIPTMGNLHDGHLSLVKSVNAANSRIVVSIFVNPMQFGKNEDFGTYPRTLEEDIRKLSNYGVDLVFAPTVEEIYPDEGASQTTVEVEGLSDILEGEYRPGFFKGVATVVNKLFNIVQPDVAVFGEKDYQQLLVIQQMVNDLAMPIEIRSIPTVREKDGLAMSSRNGYLDEDQRVLAAELNRCLSLVVQSIIEGENPNYEVGHASQALEEKGFLVDYVVVRRQQDLAVPEIDDKQLVALVAARLGDVRLIDNIPFQRA